MLTIADGHKAYGEKRSGLLLLSKRHEVFLIDDVLEKPYRELVKEYRTLHIPVRDWDDSVFTIDLFTEVAKSSIMIGESEKLASYFPRLKVELLERFKEIDGINEARSYWGCNPHRDFAVQAVKPGVHPTQDILPEEATDLLMSSRFVHAKPHNLLWCLNKYFYFSKKMGENYTLPMANEFLRGHVDTFMLSYLDVSDLALETPIRLDENYILEDDTVTFIYPPGKYDGILIFVAGKMILDIRDGHDLTFSVGKLRLPLKKLNLNITHLGDWAENFKIDDVDWDVVLKHETSFIVPYSKDIYANYKPVKNESKSPHLVSFRRWHNDGDFIIDHDGEIVPYLTEQMPNTENDKEYFVETYFKRKSNELATTNYESDKGKWEDTVESMKRLGTGVSYFEKTDNLREVNLSSFISLRYKE